MTTFTLQIKFQSDLPIEDIFAICQKSINTDPLVPGWVYPLGVVNPPSVSADCELVCSQYSREAQNTIHIQLTLPLILSEKMQSIAEKVISDLNLQEYEVYDEYLDTWHKTEKP